jgi:alpha-L-fucosidase
MLWSGVAAQPRVANGEQGRPLHELQQDFVNMRFGMFIHFNIPTFMSDDWADPDASPEIFNPQRLDAGQWARAARSAGMSYGCLTTKHHSGFCIWDTKTTDYNVMQSPYGKDVVREYADAFRKEGLQVALYYSILDTHHRLRPGFITPEHTAMVKAQITELLTNYGDIAALIIDGWDAPWSRISYDQIPFEEIYMLVKSLQPNCLVMDLNAAKYPADALFYTDIKSYEQGAGQHISRESNRLPALSCLPINTAWFWKADFPTTPVKDPKELVENNLVPFNNAYCNFLLNVAPNRDGLVDDNAVAALAEIGRLWQRPQDSFSLPVAPAPIISSNIAKFKPAESSWSWDMQIMDFANDDNFKTGWESNKSVAEPWLSIDLGAEQPFNTITVTEKRGANEIRRYRLEYMHAGEWHTIFEGSSEEIIKIHRFPTVTGSRVRITVTESATPPTIAEIGVYNESPAARKYFGITM